MKKVPDAGITDFQREAIIVEGFDVHGVAFRADELIEQGWEREGEIEPVDRWQEAALYTLYQQKLVRYRQADFWEGKA